MVKELVGISTAEGIFVTNAAVKMEYKQKPGESTMCRKNNHRATLNNKS